MKNLFYAIFALMFLATSCEALDGVISDEELDEELSENFTEDDIVGESGQIKTIDFTSESDEEGEYETISFSYDSKGRVSGIIYNYAWYEEDYSEELVENATEVAAQKSAATLVSTEDASSIFKRKKRPTSTAATRASSSVVYYYTGVCRYVFEYGSSNCIVTASEEEYCDGVLDEDDSEEITATFTLNSNGYISSFVYVGAEYELIVNDEVYLCTYTGAETIEYDNSGYPSVYTWTYTSVCEELEGYDSLYKTKEEYTYSGGNLVSMEEYWYNDYTEEFDSDGTRSVTYGSEKNNLSLDLSAFLCGAEYGESLLVMHPGIYGKAMTNLPATVSSYYGDESTSYSYTYSGGKLTEITETWGYDNYSRNYGMVISYYE